ncbi:MAG: formate dehydrogenase subunit gamma [Proteobacteria bacterium]|nr:formate dehydrogenase subunit gamma [Pseudomonadota bacterium]
MGRWQIVTIEKEGGHVSVRRYSGLARLNHWVVALTFLALMLSGAALFYPAFFGLTALFGGGQTTRWVHPWFGVVLTVSFLGLFLRFFWANLPEFTDFVWLARIREVLSGDERFLPEIGKYNAGQKFVFWSQAVLIGTMLVTGIALWDTGLSFVEPRLGIHVTMEQKRLAALIHSSAAMLAVTILIIHVYAAFWVRGTLSAMVSGWVSGGWGWKHHRKWLRREVGKPSR